MYFYGLRGRVATWLTRFRPIAARREAIVARVQRHRSLMILALFEPGLRYWIANASLAPLESEDFLRMLAALTNAYREAVSGTTAHV